MTMNATSPEMMKPLCRRRQPDLPSGQSGYTLLLAMVLILVMTVFGVYAMNGSIMQSRMAGNYQDSQQAFEAGEMGLRWGEAWLQSRTPITRPFPCQSLTLTVCATVPNAVLDANMIPYNVEAEKPTDTGSTWAQINLPYGTDPEDWNAVAGTTPIPEVAQQPRILLEQAFVDRDDLAGNPQQGRVFYRVLSAATGRRDSTVAVVESSVAKRFE